MKSSVAEVACLGLLLLASTATAQTSVFFEEQFSGPTLDPLIWRTEIMTSGVRWCDDYSGAWQGPGTWVPEGVACYGVAAQSPYGSAVFSNGLLQLSSTNGQACPYLVSRLPGGVALFPSTGDFALRVRMRFDHITPWGTFFVALQTPSTEPVGGTPLGQYTDVLLAISSGPLTSALSGSYDVIGYMPSPEAFHDVALECVGTTYTISVDGTVIYGPIASALRPTAVYLGNMVLAYWYPTDWCGFSIDYFSVEVPGPVPVNAGTWGALKAKFRD